MTRFHYLHIGKTGGTAIKHALRPYLKSGTGEIILHSHTTTLVDIPLGEPVFFTVRDPTDRFISAFNGMLRQGHPRYNDVWTPDEAKAFRNFQRAADLARTLSDPEEATRITALHAMNTIQHVSTGLQYWLGSREYLQFRKSDILWVGETPELSRQFLELRNLLSLPDTCTLPTDAYEANVHPITDNVQVGTGGAVNLRLWYRHDFDILAYCRSELIPANAVPWPRDPASSDGQDLYCGFALSPPFASAKGLAWTAPLPLPLRLDPLMDKRTLAIFENGRKLLPTSSMHVDISQFGGGANAFWTDAVCFSTSDGSNPNSNGCAYTIALEKPRFS